MAAYRSGDAAHPSTKTVVTRRSSAPPPAPDARLLSGCGDPVPLGNRYRRDVAAGAGAGTRKTMKPPAASSTVSRSPCATAWLTPQYHRPCSAAEADRTNNAILRLQLPKGSTRSLRNIRSATTLELAGTIAIGVPSASAVNSAMTLLPFGHQGPANLFPHRWRLDCPVATTRMFGVVLPRASGAPGRDARATHRSVKLALPACRWRGSVSSVSNHGIRDAVQQW